MKREQERVCERKQKDRKREEEEEEKKQRKKDNRQKKAKQARQTDADNVPQTEMTIAANRLHSYLEMGMQG